MQHIYYIYVVIFEFCKCSFKICFRAWLRQTVATSLLNRDALNFKTESVISAKRFRERNNRGTPYQTLFCSQKHPPLPPAISCESYLSSGGVSRFWLLQYFECNDWDDDLESISDKVTYNINCCVACVKAAIGTEKNLRAVLRMLSQLL